mmetsp:Transcript_2040/g.7713  ORF Transcript_2040/g.7713 Transcript_2040/m.7713 type:complete len:264 (-) Transcript_2040:598-1389(-)
MRNKLSTVLTSKEEPVRSLVVRLELHLDPRELVYLSLPPLILSLDQLWQERVRRRLQHPANCLARRIRSLRADPKCPLAVVRDHVHRPVHERSQRVPAHWPTHRHALLLESVLLGSQLEVVRQLHRGAAPAAVQEHDQAAPLRQAGQENLLHLAVEDGSLGLIIARYQSILGDYGLIVRLRRLRSVDPHAVPREVQQQRVTLRGALREPVQRLKDVLLRGLELAGFAVGVVPQHHERVAVVGKSHGRDVPLHLGHVRPRAVEG